MPSSFAQQLRARVAQALAAGRERRGDDRIELLTDGGLVWRIGVHLETKKKPSDGGELSQPPEVRLYPPPGSGASSRRRYFTCVDDAIAALSPRDDEHHVEVVPTLAEVMRPPPSCPGEQEEQQAATQEEQQEQEQAATPEKDAPESFRAAATTTTAPPPPTVALHASWPALVYVPAPPEPLPLNRPSLQQAVQHAAAAPRTTPELATMLATLRNTPDECFVRLVQSEALPRDRRRVAGLLGVHAMDIWPTLGDLSPRHRALLKDHFDEPDFIEPLAARVAAGHAQAYDVDFFDDDIIDGTEGSFYAGSMVVRKFGAADGRAVLVLDSVVAVQEHAGYGVRLLFLCCLLGMCGDDAGRACTLLAQCLNAKRFWTFVLDATYTASNLVAQLLFQIAGERIYHKSTPRERDTRVLMAMLEKREADKAV